MDRAQWSAVIPFLTLDKPTSFGRKSSLEMFFAAYLYEQECWLEIRKYSKQNIYYVVQEKFIFNTSLPFTRSQYNIPFAIYRLYQGAEYTNFQTFVHIRKAPRFSLWNWVEYAVFKVQVLQNVGTSFMTYMTNTCGYYGLYSARIKYHKPYAMCFDRSQKTSQTCSAYATLKMVAVGFCDDRTSKKRNSAWHV